MSRLIQYSFVNGFKLNTKEYDAQKLTYSSGGFVKGSDEADEQIKYIYGALTEVLELTYFIRPGDKVFFSFKSNWFDNVSSSEINVHKDYKFIELKHNSHYYKYDPFVLVKQTLQVYFAPYPSQKRDKADWSAVFKTKEIFRFYGNNIPNGVAYQADLDPNNKIIITDDHTDLGPSLNDESKCYNKSICEYRGKQYRVQDRVWIIKQRRLIINYWWCNVYMMDICIACYTIYILSFHYC